MFVGHPIVNDPIYNHVAWKLRRPDADITEVGYPPTHSLKVTEWYTCSLGPARDSKVPV